MSRNEKSEDDITPKSPVDRKLVFTWSNLSTILVAFLAAITFYNRCFTEIKTVNNNVKETLDSCKSYLDKYSKDTCNYSISTKDIDILTKDCCSNKKSCNIYFIDNSKSVNENLLGIFLDKLKKSLITPQSLSRVDLNDIPLSKLIAIHLLDKKAKKKDMNPCSVFSLNEDGECLCMTNKEKAGPLTIIGESGLYEAVNFIVKDKTLSDTTDIELILKTIKKSIDEIKASNEEIKFFNVYIISDLLDDQIKSACKLSNPNLEELRQKKISKAIESFDKNTCEINLICLPFNSEPELIACFNSTISCFNESALIGDGRLRVINLKDLIQNLENLNSIIESVNVPFLYDFEVENKTINYLKFCISKNTIDRPISIIQNKKNTYGQEYILRLVPISHSQIENRLTIATCYKTIAEQPNVIMENEIELKINEFHYFKLNFNETINIKLLHDKINLLKNSEVALEFYHLKNDFGIIMPLKIEN